MTKISALILDIGNVLIRTDYSRAYRELAKGSDLDPEEIGSQIWGSGLYQRFESGGLTEEDFVTSVLKVLGLEIGHERFVGIWRSIFDAEPIITASQLRSFAKGRRLVALSDNNPIHWPYVRDRFSVLQEFDSYVISFEVGSVKPDAAIYRAALKSAKCEAGSCLFVDDVLTNVEGARKEGIRSIQFTSPSETIEEIVRALEQ